MILKILGRIVLAVILGEFAAVLVMIIVSAAAPSLSPLLWIVPLALLLVFLFLVLSAKSSAQAWGRSLLVLSVLCFAAGPAMLGAFERWDEGRASIPEPSFADEATRSLLSLFGAFGAVGLLLFWLCLGLCLLYGALRYLRLAARASVVDSLERSIEDQRLTPKGG